MLLIWRHWGLWTFSLWLPSFTIECEAFFSFFFFIYFLDRADRSELSSSHTFYFWFMPLPVAPTSYCWFHSKMLYAVAKTLVSMSPSSYHFWNPTLSWGFCPLTPRLQYPVPISTFFPPTALALSLLCEMINVDRCSRLAHWWGCHIYFSLVAFFSPNNCLLLNLTISDLRFPPG